MELSGPKVERLFCVSLGDVFVVGLSRGPGAGAVSGGPAGQLRCS